MTGMTAHADEVIAQAVNATLDFLRDGNADAVRKRARKYSKPEAPTAHVNGPVVEEAKALAERIAHELELTVSVDALVGKPGAVNLKNWVPEPRRKEEVPVPTKKVGNGKEAELIWHDFGE